MGPLRGAEPSLAAISSELLSFLGTPAGGESAKWSPLLGQKGVLRW